MYSAKGRTEENNVLALGNRNHSLTDLLGVCTSPIIVLDLKNHIVRFWEAKMTQSHQD